MPSQSDLFKKMGKCGHVNNKNPLMAGQRIFACGIIIHRQEVSLSADNYIRGRRYPWDVFQKQLAYANCKDTIHYPARFVKRYFHRRFSPQHPPPPVRGQLLI